MLAVSAVLMVGLLLPTSLLLVLWWQPCGVGALPWISSSVMLRWASLLGLVCFGQLLGVGARAWILLWCWSRMGWWDVVGMSVAVRRFWLRRLVKGS